MFDPLAVLLLIAASISFDLLRKQPKLKEEIEEEPKPQQKPGTMEIRERSGGMEKVTRTGTDGTTIEFYE